jgi:hypothetical protein
MTRLICSTFALALAACGGGESARPDAAAADPDAPAAIDAVIDTPLPEPMPAFVVDGFTTGQLAVAGRRARDFTVGGQVLLSHIVLSLTETGAATSCSFVIFPKFVAFDFGSPANRQFKTVQYDVATSTVIADECGWDDAYVLAEVKHQYGLAEVGWARSLHRIAPASTCSSMPSSVSRRQRFDRTRRGRCRLQHGEDGTVDRPCSSEAVGGARSCAHQW